MQFKRILHERNGKKLLINPSVHAISDTLDHLVKIHAQHSEEMISVLQVAHQELILKPNLNIA